MTLVTIFTLALATQTAPADTQWGMLSEGLRMGLAIEARNDGPPILRCYFKNDTTQTLGISSKEHGSFPVPQFTFYGKKVGAFVMTPPSFIRMSQTGPGPELHIPPGASRLGYSCRLWFALTPGTYEVSAHINSALRREVGSGAARTQASFLTGDLSLDIKPSDVQPANALGNG